MKKLYFKLLILLIMILVPELISAQKKNELITGNFKITILPVRKVYLENDSAFFKVILMNKTDSVVYISKLPWAYCYDYFDAYPTAHDEEIYTFLLKKNKKHVYRPYFFSISMEDEYIGPIDSLNDINKHNYEKKVREISIHEEKIPINPDASVEFLINLFPFKSDMSPGEYKARIAFFLTNKRPYILVKSNWVKFSFE